MAPDTGSKTTEFTISLPATSANLGPAFDAAALAMNLALRVRATRAKQYSIDATGHDPEKPAPALRLGIHNGFPIGKGLGSSAAARLAGIALAVRFGHLRWNSARIVGEASKREHHPDNAAACWMGGVTVARMFGEADAHVARFVPKGQWPLMLAIPQEPLSTEKARSVLPPEYSRADAVTNIQNSMLLLAALFQGDQKLFSSSLEDRIHQPYRAELCPLLPALETLDPEDGILGVALSGAGPSVLMFLNPKSATEKTKARIEALLKSRGLKAELVLTSIARRGGEASFQRKAR
jgi:homoserine kinase